MILLPFFDILAGFRFRKNALESDVHSLRRPWVGGQKSRRFVNFYSIKSVNVGGWVVKNV